MKWVALVCLFGCARQPWQRALPAGFVPALELRTLVRGRRALDAQHADVGIGAWLRWTPRIAAATIGSSQVEQTPAAWLAPCELDDATCFTELAEAEPEIAAALRERP